MTKTEKFTYTTTALLVTTIIFGNVVVKFAPRIGTTVALTSYALAGVTSIVGAICACKDC